MYLFVLEKFKSRDTLLAFIFKPYLLYVGCSSLVWTFSMVGGRVEPAWWAPAVSALWMFGMSAVWKRENIDKSSRIME